MRLRPTTTISRLNFTARVAVGALLLLVASLGAGTSRGAATDEKIRRQTSRRRIRNMTQIERDRLRSNYKTFLALPAAKQNAYRQVRHTVEEDDRQGGPLRRVMQNYHRWLKTLSLWQRDELRQQTDPRARMKLVRQFRRQQGQETERHRLGPIGGLRRFPRLLVQPVPVLSPADFNAVMQTLERRTRFRRNEHRKLDKLSPPQRHLKVLMTAAPKGRRGRGRFNWLDGGTVTALIEVITDAEIRQQLSGETLTQKTLASINHPGLRKRMEQVSSTDWQSYFLTRMILRALYTEWRTEFDKWKPTEQQTEEFFETLSKRQQNEIISRSGFEQKRQLTGLYMQKHHSELVRRPRELQRLIPRLIPPAIVRALYQYRANKPKGPTDSAPGRDGDRLRRRSILKPFSDRRSNPSKSRSSPSRQ